MCFGTFNPSKPENNAIICKFKIINKWEEKDVQMLVSSLVVVVLFGCKVFLALCLFLSKFYICQVCSSSTGYLYFALWLAFGWTVSINSNYRGKNMCKWDWMRIWVWKVDSCLCGFSVFVNFVNHLHWSFSFNFCSQTISPCSFT